MPLFIVRWPDLSAALVRAEGELDLLDKLDEIANPDGCRWEEYDGPLFLEFKLNAQVAVEGKDAHPAGRPFAPDQLVISGEEDLASGEVPPLSVEIPGCDTGSAMSEAIASFAFPMTAMALFEPISEEVDIGALRDALRDDAMDLVARSWRQAQLEASDDPEAQRALALDMPLRLLRRYEQAARGEE